MSYEHLARQLRDLSQWVDEYPPNRQGTNLENLWGRCGKITEEVGELTAAIIGWLGQNPRKGVTHTEDDVRNELLDIAVTALCAYEHMTYNSGQSMLALDAHVQKLVDRSGV